MTYEELFIDEFEPYMNESEEISDVYDDEHGYETDCDCASCLAAWEEMKLDPDTYQTVSAYDDEALMRVCNAMSIAEQEHGWCDCEQCELDRMVEFEQLVKGWTEQEEMPF